MAPGPVTHPPGNAPSVAALVATWNGAAFIEDTLASLAAQTYPNLRVSISDDASTDDTADRCRRIAAGDPRFSLVVQPARLGWTGNVNSLLASARADCLFIMPHDDWLDPTYVSRLVEALAASPHAVLAFSDMETVDPSGRRRRVVYADVDGIRAPAARAARLAWRRPGWMIAYHGLFRARAAAQIGGLRRHGSGERGADWPWLIHMALLGEWVRVPEVLFWKRVWPGSLSASFRFTVRSWWSVTASCVRQVRGSGLSCAGKVRVCSHLAAFLAKVTLRGAGGRLHG